MSQEFPGDEQGWPGGHLIRFIAVSCCKHLSASFLTEVIPSPDNGFLKFCLFSLGYGAKPTGGCWGHQRQGHGRTQATSRKLRITGDQAPPEPSTGPRTDFVSPRRSSVTRGWELHTVLRAPFYSITREGHTPTSVPNLTDSFYLMTFPWLLPHLELSLLLLHCHLLHGASPEHPLAKIPRHWMLPAKRWGALWRGEGVFLKKRARGA